MKTLVSSLVFLFGGFAVIGADLAQPPAAPAAVVRGEVYQSASGAKLRMLMDREMFGGAELEIAEITFPPNADSGDHVHGATETFYVLEGELEHIVNGESMKLTPGLIGTVRPPDKVRHKTGAPGARTLVIWAPAGEAARIAGRWQRIESAPPPAGK